GACSGNLAEALGENVGFHLCICDLSAQEFANFAGLVESIRPSMSAFGTIIGLCWNANSLLSGQALRLTGRGSLDTNAIRLPMPFAAIALARAASRYGRACAVLFRNVSAAEGLVVAVVKAFGILF